MSHWLDVNPASKFDQTQALIGCEMVSVEVEAELKTVI